MIHSVKAGSCPAEGNSPSMESLILVRPIPSMKAAALDYFEECKRYGEAALDSFPYDAWLTHTKTHAAQQTVSPDWVQASTFFVMRKADQRLIGLVDIRYTLHDLLSGYGGHIGYGVRPSERCQGYAVAILRMVLDYARTLGLTRVMLACRQDQEASRCAILLCGGMMKRSFLLADGKGVEVYELSLSQPFIPAQPLG